MTKEEILAMKSGGELNKKVAEGVMGHEIIVDEIFGEMERRNAEDGGSLYGPLKPYSEDISVAQLVADRMIILGHIEALSWGQYGGGIYTPAEAICKAALLAVLESRTASATGRKGDRGDLLNDIIEIELDMFQRVRTSEPSLCQERPESFRVMRGMTHSVLSAETLESYLEDLQKARAKGRNLLSEKYARMQDIIPSLKVDQAMVDIIEDIVRTESHWLKEVSAKYPHCLKGQVTNFEVYLRCEIESYSDKTIRSYSADVSKAEKEGRNLAGERFDRLAKSMGYSSIAEMEEAVADKG